MRLYCLTPLACALFAACVTTQDLPDLTSDERKSLLTISEGKVLTTISFLASDALEGRDTGSKGLEVASAYVAARFRGAQLSGLGDDGSFFLYAAARHIPTKQAQIRESLGSGSKSLAGVKILACADEAIETTLDVVLAPARRSVEPSDALKGAVALFDEATSRRSRRGSPLDEKLRGTLAQVQSAKRAGARIVLVRASADSELRKKQARDSRVMSALARMDVPVLLVPEAFDTGRYFFDVPAWTMAKSENRNVCGVLRGSDPELSKQAILITAHLDHIGVFGPEDADDRIRNGADDDASGCTAVLALADAFAALEQRPKRSVIFMTFWGEEKGLLGSREFARNPAWPLEKIVANVNLEMLGRPEEGAKHKIWVTGWLKSDLGELVARGAKRVGIEVFRHKRFSQMLYRQSDNWSFVEKGVIAHSFSAGSLHEDYHKVGDEWHKLQIPHMTRVIQGLFAGVLPLAHGDLTPKAK